MNKDLTFDSLDEWKDYLKVLYQENGLAAVSGWVEDNLTRGVTCAIKSTPSGASEVMQVYDRRMELLDKNGIKVIHPDFLPTITAPVDFSVCEISFSLRILFIQEPFGIVIYKRILPS